MIECVRTAGFVAHPNEAREAEIATCVCAMTFPIEVGTGRDDGKRREGGVV